jgi:hypothetical protein
VAEGEKVIERPEMPWALSTLTIAKRATQSLPERDHGHVVARSSSMSRG